MGVKFFNFNNDRRAQQLISAFRFPQNCCCAHPAICLVSKNGYAAPSGEPVTTSDQWFNDAGLGGGGLGGSAYIGSEGQWRANRHVREAEIISPSHLIGPVAVIRGVAAEIVTTSPRGKHRCDAMNATLIAGF